MTKKILSVITTAAVLGTMACAGAVSSSAYSGEITFEVPETWANANKFFYAHIWNGLPGGAGLYAWQTADEKMTWTKGDATATYQVPDGDWNLIIVSGNTGIQTYDTVMNANCIGDTCYVMSEQFENPVDSKKVAYGLGWRNNTDCGPHKVVSSLGNIIGNAFLPGEDNQTLYDNFVKKYDENNQVRIGQQSRRKLLISLAFLLRHPQRLLLQKLLQMLLLLRLHRAAVLLHQVKVQPAALLQVRIRQQQQVTALL